MNEIKEFYKDLGNVYFVGGCVRDLLMGIEPKDYDLTTDKTPDQIEDYIKSKGRRVYLTGKRFGTISCKIGDNSQLVEITTHREEMYDFSSRKPKVTYSKHLDEDLGRRDFTINAIALKMNGQLHDPYKGYEDIKGKILRAVGSPKERFKEDPLRILRGIRIASKLGFALDGKTCDKMESCRWELERISKERFVEEINKMFELPASDLSRAMSLMWTLRTWQLIIPELQLQYRYDQDNPHHDFQLHEHTLRVMCNVRDGGYTENIMWGALLHDIGKPFTREKNDKHDYYNYINHDILGAQITDRVLRDLKFSNLDREIIVNMIKNHLQKDSILKKFDDGGKKR